MKKITASAVVTVGSGVVALTEAQARPRAHNLELLKKGKDRSEYSVRAPIQFKAGEEFLYSGEVDKLGRLHDPDAEALAKLEFEDLIRAKTRAALESEFEERLAKALAEQEARLRAELAGK